MAGGTVYAIHVSSGGVPKTARASAYIDASGVDGDRQRDLRYHGGPDRAVCLFSLDLIRALQREGHPIAPGAVGENLTIEGLDWSAMEPGARLQLGTARLELTSYTAPCRNIRHAFADERFVRISQKVHPGWSRLYARVLSPGTIAPGDLVVLERS